MHRTGPGGIGSGTVDYAYIVESPSLNGPLGRFSAVRATADTAASGCRATGQAPICRPFESGMGGARNPPPNMGFP